MERSKIDQYFEYKKLMEEASTYVKEVEALALAEASDLMSSSKDKTFKFYGTGSNCITITEQEKLDVISFEAVIQLLQGDPDGFVEEKKTKKLSLKFTKLVKNFVAGKYIEKDVKDVLEAEVKPAVDEKSYKAISKKIKGVYAKDKDLLTAYGFDVVQASDLAYFIEEAHAFETVNTLLRAYYPKAAEYEIEELREQLKKIMIVDTVLKVGSNSEEEN